MPTKYINLREFQETGYLHEVNRTFLHPLGLALEIKILTAWREPRLDPQRISVDHEGVIEKTKEGAKPYV